MIPIFAFYCTLFGIFCVLIEVWRSCLYQVIRGYWKPYLNFTFHIGFAFFVFLEHFFYIVWECLYSHRQSQNSLQSIVYFLILIFFSSLSISETKIWLQPIIQPSYSQLQWVLKGIEYFDTIFHWFNHELHTARYGVPKGVYWNLLVRSTYWVSINCNLFRKW